MKSWSQALVDGLAGLGLEPRLQSKNQLNTSLYNSLNKIIVTIIVAPPFSLLASPSPLMALPDPL